MSLCTIVMIPAEWLLHRPIQGLSNGCGGFCVVVERVLIVS